MGQEPNNYLSPLAKAKKGRNLRKTEDLWPLAGKIVLAERMWLKTQRLVALRLSEDALANVWWTFSFKKGLGTNQREKALVLWLNSTLGFLQLLSQREETRGAWVDFKKPTLAALPVLDLRALPSEQLKQLATAYDRLAKKEISPIPQMNTDAVRAEIDASIAGVLRLPDFSILRERLAQEPVVCMKPLA